MTTYMETRAGYAHFVAIPTRCTDADIHGRVHSPVYYAYFDTVIQDYLTGVGGLDLQQGDFAVYCVESLCRYHRSLSFPATVDAGLRVAELGQASVRYEIGLFRAGEDKPAAQGHWVQVFVSRGNDKPTAIPAALRAALEHLRVKAPY